MIISGGLLVLVIVVSLFAGAAVMRLAYGSERRLSDRDSERINKAFYELDQRAPPMEPSADMISAAGSIPLPSYEGKEQHMAYDIVSEADCRAIYKAMVEQHLRQVTR